MMRSRTPMPDADLGITLANRPDYRLLARNNHSLTHASLNFPAYLCVGRRATREGRKVCQDQSSFRRCRCILQNENVNGMNRVADYALCSARDLKLHDQASRLFYGCRILTRSLASSMKAIAE